MRSIFGWDFPPGAEHDPNAPYNQQDGPCEVCGNFPDYCVCPECPRCGENGNPDCYDVASPYYHKLQVNEEQAAAHKKNRQARECKERNNEE